MPNINGSVINDIINVTNNVGTLNGTAQGTPINIINAKSGDDTITVTNSTIVRISAQAGDDTISISNSTVTSSISGDGGNDTITISNSTVKGTVRGANGDDVITVNGSTINRLILDDGDDTLNLTDTTVKQRISGGKGTDSLNLPPGTVVMDSTFGTFTITSGTAYRLNSGTLLLPTGQIIKYNLFERGTGITCFNQNTLIQTAKGQIQVQDLKVGDMIQTASNGRQPIRWIGKRKLQSTEIKVNPKLRPIRIMAGALTCGLPLRDLLVSRQHRVLVQSKIAERMFGASEVLVSAILLTKLPGVYIDHEIEEVTYFHLLFNQHEVIFSEGAPTESLYSGPEALNAISAEGREEILTLFPKISELDYTQVPASFIPTRNQQKQLIQRHIKNSQPFLFE